ncbi:unnamed protein product [Jaminaea pallidilutea]
MAPKASTSVSASSATSKRSATALSPSGPSKSAKTAKSSHRSASSDSEDMTDVKIIKAVKPGSSSGSGSDKGPKKMSQSGLLSFANGNKGSNSAGSSSKAVEWHPLVGVQGSCLVGEYGDAMQATVKACDQANRNGPDHLQKIAAFDLDGTLIETASGRAAYNYLDENDWRLWGKSGKEGNAVVNKVREEAASGSLILVVTSQFSLISNTDRLKVWKRRLRLIANRFDVPLVVIASGDKDAYRKPCAGWADHIRDMWATAGGQATLDLEQGASAPPLKHSDRSFFVGDAAGRIASKAKGAGKARAADFADTDRKLAENLHWRFFTPEEYFLGEEPLRWQYKGFKPNTPASDATRTAATSDLVTLRQRLLEPKRVQTLLLLIGPQASGKSRFAQSLVSASQEAKGLQQWVRVNRDIMKSMDRCISVARTALAEGKSVVVDNTNPSREKRQAFLELARERTQTQTDDREPLKVVAIHFDVSKEQAQHNDLFRSKRWTFADAKTAEETHALIGKLPKPMPPIAFNTYFKNLEPPVLAVQEGTTAKEENAGSDEGFHEVHRLPFAFEQGEEGDADTRAYHRWYA